MQRDARSSASCMGSDSDWPVMKAAAEALDEFGVPYEADVVSAHRMPEEMIEYGSSARAPRAARDHRRRRGRRAPARHARRGHPAAGDRRPRPAGPPDGLDSLLSIVQMPAGIPVATVAVGGARNAGLLAVRILAAAEGPAGAALRARLTAFAAPWPTRPGPRARPCATGAEFDRTRWASAQITARPG